MPKLHNVSQMRGNYSKMSLQQLAPASEERADQRRHVKDVGAFFYLENEDNEMKHEPDDKELEHYTGGMEPRSVFPLMDEFEAEWGIDDD